MIYESKITFKFESKFNKSYCEESLPEEVITYEFPAQDVSAIQIMDAFRKFIIATGQHPDSVASAGAYLAFNEYRSPEEMKKTADEYDLYLVEDYVAKLAELQQEINNLNAKISRLENPDNPQYTDEEMNAMSPPITKQTLVDAYKVCNDCGTEYGDYSAGCSSRWIDKCDVCGETKAVTEARDYNYLRRGIEELSKQ